MPDNRSQLRDGISTWRLTAARRSARLVSITRNHLKTETKDRRAPEPEAAAEVAAELDGAPSLDQQIARRLQALRSGRGWTLEALAERTGISRASLSRVERGELSPTAAMLGVLCAQYGWTISRLMAEAERAPAALVRGDEQVRWKDPETGFARRIVSPPSSQLKGELIEGVLPAGASIGYPAAPIRGLEHHLWLLDGELELDIEGTRYRLAAGDCLRYVLSGASRFANRSGRGRRAARYVIALVHP